MALTITKVSREIVGTHVELTVDITCDNSYPANGYPLGPELCGGKTSDRVLGLARPVYTDDGYIGHYVTSTKKLKFFKVGSAGPLTEAATTNLNTKTARVVLAVK